MAFREDFAGSLPGGAMRLGLNRNGAAVPDDRCALNKRLSSRRKTMRWNRFILAVCSLSIALGTAALGRQARGFSVPPQNGPSDDPVRLVVGRLDLESYKATIKA